MHIKDNFPGNGNGKGKFLASLAMFNEAKEFANDMGPTPGFPSVIRMT